MENAMQYPPIRPNVYRFTAALGAVVVILAASIQVSEAQVSTPRNPYCIRDGVFGSGSWDCSFHNWQQCYDSSLGAGGWCTENPNYQPRVKQRKQRTQQQRR